MISPVLIRYSSSIGMHCNDCVLFESGRVQCHVRYSGEIWVFIFAMKRMDSVIVRMFFSKIPIIENPQKTLPH